MNSNFGRYMRDLLHPPLRGEERLSTTYFWPGDRSRSGDYVIGYGSDIIGAGSDSAARLLVMIFGPPLSDESANAIFLDQVGAMLDELKEAIFGLRRLWLLALTPAEALDIFGESRGMKRLPGENDEVYRQRQMAAADEFALGGTPAGVDEAIRRVTPVAFTIDEPRTDRWVLGVAGKSKLGFTTRLGWEEAAFLFRITFAESLSSEIEAEVRRQVDATKPKHTSYVIRYNG
ncbi:MAG: phage tail protein [Bacteroidota bacterium]